MRMAHRPTGASTAESAEPVAARARRCGCHSPKGVHQVVLDQDTSEFPIDGRA